MGKSTAHTEDTISIDASGNAVALELNGRTIVSFIIEGDATAEYQLDARRVGGSWKQNVGKEYTGASDYDDVVETGAEEIRIRCSTGTAGTGDEAAILMMAGGG